MGWTIRTFATAAILVRHAILRAAVDIVRGSCPAGDPRAPRGPLVVLPAVPAQFFSLAHLLSIAPRRRLAERRADDTAEEQQEHYS